MLNTKDMAKLNITARITTFCSPGDLYSLSLVDKATHRVVIPQLYETVEHDITSSQDRIVNFLATIYAQKRVAELVTTLKLDLSQISLRDNPVRASSRRANFQNLLTLLCDALHCLPKLKHFELFVQSRDNNGFTSQLIFDKLPFKLESFSTNICLNHATIIFLLQQEYLTKLHLKTGCELSIEDGQHILRTTLLLPRLESLGWSSNLPMELIAQLFQMRDISEITLFLDDRATAIYGLHGIDDIGLSYVKTVVLHFTEQVISNALCLLSTRARNVVHLKLLVRNMSEVSNLTYLMFLLLFPST